MLQDPSQGKWGHFAAKAQKLVARGHRLAGAAIEHLTAVGRRTAGTQMRAWDAFQWSVIALLVVNLFLVVLLRTRPSHPPDQGLAITRAEVQEAIAGSRNEAAQVILAIRSELNDEIAKTNTQLEALTQALSSPNQGVLPPRPTVHPKRR